MRVTLDHVADEQLGHVAHLVYHSFLANRLVVSRYGEVTSVADIWLDLDYPYVAPPEYERSGYVRLQLTPVLEG